MTKILNHINTYADLTAYNADLYKDFPNISYIQGTDEVKWNKYDPDHIVAVYNVTSTESATKLLDNTDDLAKQYIDGVEQQSIQTTYTFDTLGEHIVKYKLTGTKFSQWGNQFNGVTALTEVSVPDTVTTMGNTVFMKCTNLVKAKLSYNNNRIGDNIFNGCVKLPSFTIPKNVTEIGNTTFVNCTSLTSVTCLSTTPPTLGTNVFLSTNTNLVIYVPAESVEAYKAANRWSTYASRIKAIPTT